MKLKEILFSEKGMKTVNALFFLSALFYRSRIILAAYAVWIVYLAFGIRHAENRGSRTVYAVLLVFAAVMAGLNLFFLLR